MNRSSDEAFEAFLVEDVILTLSTVRGAIGWLGDETGCPPAQRAACCARIERQIGTLEERARDLWRRLRAAPFHPVEAAEGEIINLFDLTDGDERCRHEAASLHTHRACA